MAEEKLSELPADAVPVMAGCNKLQIMVKGIKVTHKLEYTVEKFMYDVENQVLFAFVDGNSKLLTSKEDIDE